MIVQCVHDFPNEYLGECSHVGKPVEGGGATFRAWAPLATAVYINGTFGVRRKLDRPPIFYLRETPMDIGQAFSVLQPKAIRTISGLSDREAAAISEILTHGNLRRPRRSRIATA